MKGNGLSLTRADMSCARGGQPVSGPEFGHTVLQNTNQDC